VSVSDGEYFATIRDVEQERQSTLLTKQEVCSTSSATVRTTAYQRIHQLNRHTTNTDTHSALYIVTQWLFMVQACL